MMNVISRKISMKTRFPLLALAFLAVLLVVFAARAAVSWVGSIIMSAPSTNNSTLYLGNSGIFYENSSGNAVFQILTTTFLVTNHGNVYDLGGVIVNPASGYQFTAGGNLASADLNIATPSGIANKYAVQVNVGANDDFNVQPPIVFANGVRLRSANDADNALEAFEFAATVAQFTCPVSATGFTNTGLLGASSLATDANGKMIAGSSSGGGGTNSGIIWIWTTQTDSLYTNLGVNCACPVGVITNSPLPFRTILTNSILVANPSNMLDGQTISIEFVEPTTGQCQVVWGTAFNTTNVNQAAWAISTNANTRTFCTFRYNGSTNFAGTPITNWSMLGVSYGN
jgi:hypothetical protein